MFVVKQVKYFVRVIGSEEKAIVKALQYCLGKTGAAEYINSLKKT